MSILLTGANGQVGWEAQRLAGEQSVPLIALSRTDLDISDRTAVDARLDDLRPSIVINGAAYTAVDKAEQETELAFAVNRDGPAHLAQACFRLGIPLLHISTDYVFDGRKGAPYREDDPVNPLNVYGESKLAGENAVRDVLDRHIILRTSWVFGSHGNNFVKTVLRLANKGGPLRIVDDQRGAPTSARAIARYSLDLAQNYVDRGDLPWGTYHFSGQPYATWYGFAREILARAKEAGLTGDVDVVPITTSEFPTSAKRPPNTCMDCERCVELLGYSPDDWRGELQTVLRDLSRTA